MILPLSLSYDHRVIDNTSAVHFVAYLKSLLADIRRLLLQSYSCTGRLRSVQ